MERGRRSVVARKVLWDSGDPWFRSAGRLSRHAEPADQTGRKGPEDVIPQMGKFWRLLILTREPNSIPYHQGFTFAESVGANL